MTRAILTACGHLFDLQYCREDKVVIDDIAHALAQINRFTGHCRRPYSVAEHSLLVLEIIERLFTVDVHGRLAALLHDAHEAYVGDVASPTKLAAGDGWAQLEHRVERTVRSAFALHGAHYNWRDAIRQADLIALATEREQLMPAGGGTWEILVHVQPVQWVSLMAPERCAMTWHEWRDRFRDAYDALDFARNDALYPVKQP